VEGGKLGNHRNSGKEASEKTKPSGKSENMSKDIGTEVVIILFRS
jgi:hypothetical protein